MKQIYITPLFEEINKLTTVSTFVISVISSDNGFSDEHIKTHYLNIQIPNQEDMAYCYNRIFPALKRFL